MNTAKPCAATQPRARGAVSLTVRATDRGTVLSRLRQSGSLKILFPRSPPPECQACLVNTAGGVTGGDDFAFHARAEPGARLGLTTQAAERAYRAQPGQTGVVRNRLFIGGAARIDWIPQETILYDGCALRRSLCVEMAENATLLLVEALVFGRAAMGETLTRAQFRDTIDIRRQGTRLYLDKMTFDGDIAAHLARPNIAAGAVAMATLVYVAADAGAQLDPVRGLLPGTAGASLIREGLLGARILAADSHVLRRSLIPILSHLAGHDIPRPWMT